MEKKPKREIINTEITVNGHHHHHHWATAEIQAVATAPATEKENQVYGKKQQIHPSQLQWNLRKKLSNEGTTNPIATPKSSPNQSKTILPNSRIHGNMLVLSRPAPKSPPAPQTTIPETKDKFPSLSSTSSPNQPIPAVPDPDPITLNSPSSIPAINPSPIKSDRFIPPHLRPGFVPREEKPTKGVEINRKGDLRGGYRPGSIHRTGGFTPETFERRPISGGGNRPSSSG